MRPFLTIHGAAGTAALLGCFFEAFVMLRVTGGVTVGDALILTSAVLLMVLALRGQARIWMPAWLLIALPLVAAGIAADALFVGRYGRTDVIIGIEFAFCAIVLPAIIASQLPDALLVRRLVLAWVAGNLVGAVIAYLQFHGFELRPLARWLVWNSGRVAGLTPNPNTLGASLALVAPICLALGAETRRPSTMVLWVGAALACLHVIDLTGSRTAFAAAVIGLVVVAFFFGVHTRLTELRMRLAQVAGVLVLAGVAWHLRSGYHDSAIERWMGHSPSAALSSYFRAALHGASLEAISAAPFLGYGYASMGRAAHNVPMALIQGGGLLAFTGFMLAQGCLLAATVRLYLQSRHDMARRGFAIGLLGVWFAWIALGTYDVSVLNRNAYLAFGMAVLWRTSSRGTVRATASLPLPIRANAA